MVAKADTGSEFRLSRQRKEDKMTTDKNRPIAGISIKYLSAALRLCGNRFTPSALATALGAEYEPAAVERMIGLHYIKREFVDNRETLCLTERGKLLIAIKGMSPIKR